MNEEVSRWANMQDFQDIVAVRRLSLTGPIRQARPKMNSIRLKAKKRKTLNKLAIKLRKDFFPINLDWNSVENKNVSRKNPKWSQTREY